MNHLKFKIIPYHIFNYHVEFNLKGKYFQPKKISVWFVGLFVFLRKYWGENVDW